MKQHATLYQALDAARQAFPTIVKNRQNPHFKSRYADLSAVLGAVEGPLRENGLALRQTVTGGAVETYLHHHATGETVTCFICLPEGLTDPQKVGSAITYYRRYGVVTLLGLVTEDDDDGNAVTTESDAKQPRKRAARSAASPSSPEPGAGDGAGGWDSPAQRASAHDALLARLHELTEEQKAGLRTQVEAMGGFPLSIEDFVLVNVAANLFDGRGQIDIGGKDG